MILFTSDQHFYHRNVLNFEDRPYDTIEEMNEGLIKSWNEIVSPEDTVYHLGDFCLGGYDKWTSILDQLNGKIILIKGNHDGSKHIKKLVANGYLKTVHEVGKYIKVKGEDKRYQLWLTHYPMEIGMRPRKYSLHGHIHSEHSSMANQINLGVDSQLELVKSRPFGQPVPIEDIISYLDSIDPFVEGVFLESRE